MQSARQWGQGTHRHCWVAFPLLLQNAYRICPQRDGAVGIFRFQRSLPYLAIDAANLTAHPERLSGEINVLPLETQQFTPAQTSCQFNVVHLENSGVLGLQQKCCQLVSAQGLHFPVLRFGKGAAVRGVMRDQVLLDGKLHGGRNDLIDVADSFRAETLCLFLGFLPLHSALCQQLLIELLKIQRGQLRQQDRSNGWFDVVADVALIGFVGGRTYFNLSVVFVPDVHPLTHRVFLPLRHIQTLALFDGGLEFLFCLCLRFCQHIFDDGLAGDRIVACGIAALPATIKKARGNVQMEIEAISSFMDAMEKTKGAVKQNEDDTALETEQE